MRVLIIGMNYLPESASMGPYTAGLASYLSSAGDDVRVVTSFPMFPQWRIWDDYRGKWFSRETVDGIDVQRTYVYVPAEPRRAHARVLYDLSFSASALVGALRGWRADVVLSISPPLQLGVTGWLVSRLMRAPFFFHIQDLVPDAAIATGLLEPGSLPIRLAQRLERFIYRRADGIGVICPGFAANLRAKQVPASKTFLLPNYIDLDFMRPHPRDNAFRRAQGIGPDEFVVMYSGSIGLKQGLGVLIDAARLLQGEPKIRVVLVGEGPPLAELRQRAESMRLGNVLFLPFQPRPALPEQLAAADVLVITQRRAVTDVVFPGKLVYYMAAGRPVLAAVSAGSETGRFIAEEKVGLVTRPEEADDLAAAVRALRAGGALEMGCQARSVVERMFDQRVVLPVFRERLAALAANRGRVGAGAKR